MKKICAFAVLLGLFSLCVYSQKRSRTIIKKNVPVKVSKDATIIINFLDLPGVENDKSSWEVAYELRIIDGNSLVNATKTEKLKEMSIEEEKVGDFIGKGSFRKENLSQIVNRRVVLQIPFDEKIQEKLKNVGNLRQEFLFYGSAIVFDGKLKKNIIVPLGWVWRYEIYPDAKFGMEFSVETNENGYSYSRKTFLPDKLPKGYFSKDSQINRKK